MLEYPNFHSVDTDKKYYIVLGGRGLGKTYSQEQYVRSHYPLSFLKDFYKVCNSDLCKDKCLYGKGLCEYELSSVSLTNHLCKEMINRIYGKEGTGEMKEQRYKFEVEVITEGGLKVSKILDNNGNGYKEGEHPTMCNYFSKYDRISKFIQFPFEEVTGEIKRYKITYDEKNMIDKSWHNMTCDKFGKGYTEEEISFDLIKVFRQHVEYRNIKIEEFIPKSELFEELFFIQYRVFGKQEIEVDFFTSFRDFCYHIVKISTDLGDFLNADKVAATQRGICEGFFQNVQHNKKFKELYKIVEVDGNKYFRGLKG